MFFTVFFRNFAVVIELDRHLEILLLGNDCVIVPDFGGFMAHHVDARKDSADGMLLPPARTIGFNPKLTINDSLLAQSYVEYYDISYPEALVRIGDEVRELKQHLENDGSYELHGVGVVSLNGEGHYVFEPCEAGVLTPSLYGLSGFEMQSLAELEEKREKSNGNELRGANLMDDAPKRPEGAEGIRELNIVENNGRNVIAFWRTIAAACVAALAFLLYPSSLDNNRQLQTAGAINVDLLQRVLPHTEKAGATPVARAAGGMQRDAKVARAQVGGQDPTREDEVGYVIVLASRVSLNNAEAYVGSLTKRGYPEARVVSNSRGTKVVYGFYPQREEANHALRDLRKNAEFAEAWVMKHYQ